MSETQRTPTPTACATGSTSFSYRKDHSTASPRHRQHHQHPQQKPPLAAAPSLDGPLTSSTTTTTSSASSSSSSLLSALRLPPWPALAVLLMLSPGLVMLVGVTMRLGLATACLGAVAAVVVADVDGAGALFLVWVTGLTEVVVFLVYCSLDADAVLLSHSTEGSPIVILCCVVSHLCTLLFVSAQFDAFNSDGWDGIASAIVLSTALPVAMPVAAWLLAFGLPTSAALAVVAVVAAALALSLDQQRADDPYLYVGTHPILLLAVSGTMLLATGSPALLHGLAFLLALYGTLAVLVEADGLRELPPNVAVLGLALLLWLPTLDALHELRRCFDAPDIPLAFPLTGLAGLASALQLAVTVGGRLADLPLSPSLALLNSWPATSSLLVAALNLVAMALSALRLGLSLGLHHAARVAALEALSVGASLFASDPVRFRRLLPAVSIALLLLTPRPVVRALLGSATQTAGLKGLLLIHLAVEQRENQAPARPAAARDQLRSGALALAVLLAAQLDAASASGILSGGLVYLVAAYGALEAYSRGPAGGSGYLHAAPLAMHASCLGGVLFGLPPVLVAALCFVSLSPLFLPPGMPAPAVAGHCVAVLLACAAARASLGSELGLVVQAEAAVLAVSLLCLPAACRMQGVGLRQLLLVLAVCSGYLLFLGLDEVALSFEMAARRYSGGALVAVLLGGVLRRWPLSGGWAWAAGFAVTVAALLVVWTYTWVQYILAQRVDVLVLAAALGSVVVCCATALSPPGSALGAIVFALTYVLGYWAAFLRILALAWDDEDARAVWLQLFAGLHLLVPLVAREQRLRGRQPSLHVVIAAALSTVGADVIGGALAHLAAASPVSRAQYLLACAVPPTLWAPPLRPGDTMHALVLGVLGRYAAGLLAVVSVLLALAVSEGRILSSVALALYAAGAAALVWHFWRQTKLSLAPLPALLLGGLLSSGVVEWSLGAVLAVLVGYLFAAQQPLKRKHHI